MTLTILIITIRIMTILIMTKHRACSINDTMSILIMTLFIMTKHRNCNKMTLYHYLNDFTYNDTT
jgi:hypothetical protein